MNPAHELARERYRSYLEDAFDSEELLELARLLELEIPDECDPADMTAVLESIVGRIEEAGALDSLLMQEDRSTLGLLVQLLDLGEVHPPCSFHSDSFGLGTEHDVEAEDFFVLKRVAEHFTIYFDKGSLPVAEFAAKEAERSLVAIEEGLNYEMKGRYPLVMYNSHNGFAVSNISGQELTEFTGGDLRERLGPADPAAGVRHARYWGRSSIVISMFLKAGESRRILPPASFSRSTWVSLSVKLVGRRLR